MVVLEQSTVLREARRMPHDILGPLRACIIGPAPSLDVCTSQVEQLSNATQVAARLGEPNEHNPLAQYVYTALLNSGHHPVAFIGVADPQSLDSWKTALQLARQPNIYGLVPVSDQLDVLQLVIQQVADPYACDLGLRRTAWLPILANQVLALSPMQPGRVRYVLGGNAAAALAGLASAIVPHQSLAGISLYGLAGDLRNTQVIDAAWTVSDCATTDPATDRAEIVQRTVDAVAYYVLHRVQRWAATSVGNFAVRSHLGAQFRSAVDYFAGRSTVSRIGSSLRAAKLREVRPHALFKDRVVLELELDIPAAGRIIGLPLVAAA